MTKIGQKIAEIQRQPEHVKLRWVWLGVSFSMLLVTIIWLFSLTFLFKGDESNPSNADSIEDLKKQLQQLKQQTPSTQAGGQNSVVQSQGGANNNFQYPAASTTENSSEIPQAAGYENLQNTQEISAQ